MVNVSTVELTTDETKHHLNAETLICGAGKPFTTQHRKMFSIWVVFALVTTFQVSSSKLSSLLQFFGLCCHSKTLF